ncbi:TetR/AcrR family transcriptional regulator [Limibacillus halophilus]
MPSARAHPSSFQTLIEQEAEGPLKRERTRARLKRAGCGLLNRHPLSALKVADICAEAGVAHGTFYLYYSDQRAFLVDLLEGFVDFLQESMRAASRAEAADPVRAATAAYVRLFIANPGLMKCLVNHLEDFPEARSAFQQLNRQWAERIVKAAESKQAKEDSVATLPREELMRRAYALGGMVDQYLSSLVLQRDETLITVSQDMESVIDCLSGIWRRGMAG